MLGNWKWLQRRRKRRAEQQREVPALRAMDAELLEDRVLFSAAPIDLDALQVADAVETPDAMHEALNAIAESLHQLDSFADIPAAPTDVDALGDASWDAVHDDPADAVEEEPAVPAIDGDHTSTASHELVFIDRSVEGYETLVKDLHSAGAADRLDIVFIDANEDGIEKITNSLAKRRDYDSIRIVSHGNERGIRLGDAWLSGATLDHFRSEVAAWGESLNETGDLSFAGCDLAASSEGRAFLESVGALCDCDVTASNDWIANHVSPTSDHDLPADTTSTHNADLSSSIDPSTGELMQFVSQGHVLGFGQDSILVASASHSLQIEFVGANLVGPVAGDSAIDSDGTSGAAVFSSVTYAGVWDGVTAVYDSQDGAILKSTYYVDGGLDGDPVDLIRLQYNRAVSLDDYGNLVIAYDHGTMTDSAPIAWQIIDGHQIAVEVHYALLGTNEVGFTVGDYDRNYQLVIDPTLTWNTFLGGAGDDSAYSIAVDGSGNVYVAGYSSATWGSPVRAYTSGYDGFVAKLGSSGTVLWNTFLGGSGANDFARDVALDASGNIYVAGQASATWGSPIRAFGGGLKDGFAAKLDSSGGLLWNTFLGGSGDDESLAIAIDASDNVYVSGNSNATWGTPVRAYTGDVDAIAVKLTSAGALTWNTFLGGSGPDGGHSIAVDGSGNVYLAGYSSATWGTPVRAYGGGYDMIAVELNSSGGLTWNTFLGSSGYEVANGISLDGGGNIYLAGYGDTNWGSPVQAYSGGGVGVYDAQAVRLTSAGALTWNTFMGASGVTDLGSGITVDGSGNVLISGYSNATWGTPWRAYTSGADAFAAQLDDSGNRIWNTFLGGGGTDFGNAVAVDAGVVYVAGRSDATWGSPVRSYTSGNDAFVAKIATAGIVTVDTTIDENNGDTSSIAALIATPGGAGISWLREAIIAANNTANDISPDEIHFSIGTGAQTITPLSALPLITDTVVIDGTTQTGFAGTPIIEINGASAGASTIGLNLLGSGSTVQGLIINRFTSHGIAFNGDSSGHTIVGNYLGTDITGSIDLGNGGSGVSSLFSMGSNTIGGASAALRNVISGNNGIGISLFDGDNNLVIGNYVGVAADGSSPLANGTGIYILSASNNNTIGGTGFGEANIIAHNTTDGVEVSSGTGNKISANSIHSNGGLGIDLGTSGVTANDTGDGDSGANNLQNFAVLQNAATGAGHTNIQGTYNGAASSTFSIQYFTSSTADASGYGEGESYLGSDTITTNGSGNATFNATFAVGVTPGHFVSATVTDSSNNTSEFSLAIAAFQGVVVTTTVDENDGDTSSISGLIGTPGGTGISLREAIIATNNTANGGSPDEIRFNIAGAGPHTFTLSSALPGFTESVLLDGWTEPDFAGTPVIEIDGNGVASGIDLLAGSAGSTVRGLALHSFTGSSMEIYTGSNTIVGNYIGTDTTGTAAGLGSTGNGIAVVGGAGNTIGGNTSQLRNVIVSNAGPGIRIVNAGSTGTIVLGNYIGIGANGTTVLGNLGAGVSLSNGTSGNFIGGSGVGEGNLIAGNTGDGIEFTTFAGSNNNTIQGNLIGTIAGNSGSGIHIETGSTGNIIGGIGAGEGNTITGSGADGITIAHAGATGNSIRGNSIFANFDLGIDLIGGSQNGFGVTANDASDPDAGANNLQNYPVLDAFATTNESTTVTVTGTFNSTASSTFNVDFFASLLGDADASGQGEGRTYIGSAVVNTDGSGNATLNEAIAANVAEYQIISATVTDASGNTSEFSGTSITVTPNVSGTVYSDQGVTPLANQTVTVAVNGTDVGSAVSDGSGNYLITGLTINNGDVVTVYLEDETADAVTVTISDGTSLDIDLYQDFLIVRQENGTALTTANLNSAEVAGEDDILNIYDVTGTTLVVKTGKELLIPTGHRLDTNGTTNLFHLDIDGILDVGGNAVTISGSLDNSGTFTTTGVVTFNAAGSQTINTGGTGTGNDFQHLTINSGGGTLTLVGNNLDVDGTLTISGGTFVQGSALTITAASLTLAGGTFNGGDSLIDINGTAFLASGTFNATSGSMNVAGHWTNSGATFNHQNGSVILDGTFQNIGGNSTFYNLTKTVAAADTLTFGFGMLQTIAAGGSLTLQGASGQLLTLASGGFPDFALNVNAAATQNVSYVSVSKSNAGAGATINAANSTNGGGNLNWLFGPNTVTVDTVADENDGDTSSITALIATPGGTGISLREAIIAANNTANGGVPDEIWFNITAPLVGGAHTIAVTGAALPTITEALVIDGTTDSDFAGSPIIELDGTAAGAFSSGLSLSANGSTIRGLVINRFSVDGIRFDNSDNNLIVGNYIGVDVTGTLDRGNLQDGIELLNDSANNTIGGTTAADRNVISGNDEKGIELRDPTTTDNIIQGNYIGTNAAGNAVIGNTSAGVLIANSANNTIGGLAAGSGNVIGGNAEGVVVGSSSNIVQGNYIGTNASGDNLGNVSHGVYINSTAMNVTVGGTAAGAGNEIAFNGGDGISITNGSGHAILGNSIYGNSGLLGIDLNNDGVTFNDVDDVDGGVNNLLNFPVLTNVFQNGANLDIDFMVDLLAGNYRIEFYDNAGGLDTSGFGEGETFIGFANITVTGATGYESFSTTLTSVTASDVGNITVTATVNVGGGNFGSTSEFGPQFQGAGVLTVTTTSDVADGNTSSITALLGNRGADGLISLREAITAANNTANIGGNPDEIRFNIVGAGPHTINLLSSLPLINEALLIDGWSEPDFAGTPIIELNGAGAGGGNGLNLNANGSTIRGLVINRFGNVGIQLSGVSNSLIVGNYIGTDVSGTVDLGNGGNGITIDASDMNTIGGTTAADRNVISGNNSHGISLQSNAANNTIIGNYIGTNAEGTAALGNTNWGIAVNTGANNNTIGGSSAAERNVISGNTIGLDFTGVGVTLNTVSGNYIGLNAAGNAVVANTNAAFSIAASANANVIGGATSAYRNVIAGAGLDGIRINGADDTQILSNYIGTDATGTIDFGFTQEGVEVLNGSGTIIGAIGQGNLISGNNGPGIGLQTGATNTIIQGNLIGTNAAGTSGLANSLDGIQIVLGASNTTVGGTVAGQGNIIAFNGLHGIVLTGNGTGNAIRGNSIHSNTLRGIDLDNDGVTTNDLGDGDLGANELQNYPVLTSAVSVGGSTTIQGTFNGAVSTTFNLDFFSSPTADPSDNGEGTVYLGSDSVMTDGSGNATINTVLATSVTTGHVVTATATDASNNTSEFALNVMAVPATTLTPVGGETRVNTSTTGTQETTPYGGGNVAMDSSGNYVIVFTDTNVTSGDIYAQRYNASGVAQGAPFRVNSTTSGIQDWPVAAMDPNGNFVVGWNSNNQDGSGWGLYAQRFDAAGVAQGSAFRVNTNTTGNQEGVSIGMADDGSFVMSFTDFNSTSGDIFVQRYNAAGVPQGGNVLVNTTTSNEQQETELAVNGNGDFVVVWESSNQDTGSSWGIYGQRYNASGVAQGGEFLVNTTTAGDQRKPAVALDSSGNFVVAWHSLTQDPGGNAGIYAQRFNAAGVAQGSEFRVNTTTVNDQSVPAMAMRADGTFLISWESDSQDAAGTQGVYAQLYDASGAALGGETLVNTTTAGDQIQTAVEFRGGSAVLAWSGNGTGDTTGVFMQRYSVGLSGSVIVDTTADENDGDTSSIAALIATPGGTGISLREAIIAANNTVNGGSPDEIWFNIAGAGPHTITVNTAMLGALPTITDAIIIDGTTESGASLGTLVTGTQHTLMIELRSDVAGSADGLTVGAGADGSTIQGLVLNNFATAIVLQVDNNTVVGNYIGTNIAGSAALPNFDKGIVVDSSGSNIIQNNLVSGNLNGADEEGILLQGASATGNIVRGNIVGLNATGTAAIGNHYGVRIISGANGNTIGGTSVTDRNIISGNNTYGILIEGSSTINNLVVGNFIGTDLNGTADLGNLADGVLLNVTSMNTIGGAASGAGNVIAGNDGNGVHIVSGSDLNQVLGNFIGTDQSGTLDLGNQNGIRVAATTGPNRIGGTGPNEGNVIAFNTLDGITVSSDSAGTSILGNLLYSNDRLGIDLEGGSENGFGVSSNDAGDGDTGANDLLNFPVLTNVVQNGANLDIEFAVDLVAGNYRIEFFDNASGLDASGFGEGETFVGFATITVTGAAGYETFSTTLTGVTASDVANITVTATEDFGGGNYGSTSEFGPQLIGAGVLVVDTTSDASNGDTSSIAALLGNRGVDGLISLREAITAANNTANIGGNPEEIRFNIAGAVPHTINVLSALPSITDSVFIDGWSEPDWTLAPIIELNGTGAGATDGLLLSGTGSDGSTIRGLVINRFALSGIGIDNSDNNTIQGNYIGTDVNGLLDRGNTSQGIALFNGASNNLIGGTTVGQGNLISGNDANGINFTGVTTTGNTVVGNIIGLMASGTASLGNTFVGVAIAQGANGNTIGGSVAGARNIISGNAQYGIRIVDTGTNNNVVRGNYVGTNVAGTAAIGNANDGIRLESAGTLNGTIIGGTNAGEGNVISGNAGDGIELRDGVTNVTIAGNVIGLNASGTASVSNAARGVYVLDSNNNTIGGGTAAARNVISGNVSEGVLLSGAGATGNKIQGNYIGLNTLGTATLGNLTSGIWLESGANANIIGTDLDSTNDATEGNVVSGNLANGIQLWGASVSGNFVRGNLVGVNPAATVAMGNGMQGIQLGNGANNNTIGGTSALAANVVGGSTFAGIELRDSGTSNNVIQGNFVGTNSGGVANLGNGTHGILLALASSNNTIGGIAAGAGNRIAFNTSDGVAITSATATGNAIQGNSIYSNSGLGIDLNDDGVSAQ